MALHKLIVDDFIEETYSLFAIHCTIEDFRIAYLINQHLNINLRRKRQDLDFKYITASYPIFEWKDTKRLITWNLVSNECKKEEDSLTSSGSLFEAPAKIIKTHHLVSEYKKVNFFLKVNSETIVVNDKAIINKIQQISKVATVYSVDITRLKNRDHLIFN